jgi:restriction system protein
MDLLNQYFDFLLALFQQLWILFWPMWIGLGLFFLVLLSYKLYKTYRLSRSGIAELDKLEGQDFEKYLELLFRKLGYKVKRTPYRGDYGADLIIQKDGVQTVVQAKRYKRSVGVKAIQEAVTAKEYYKCSQAMVVTNSYYSQQARKLAKANRVRLWDRNELVNQLLSVKKQAPQPESF